MTETTPITTPFKWETTAAEVVAGINLGGSRVIVTVGHPASAWRLRVRSPPPAQR